MQSGATWGRCNFPPEVGHGIVSSPQQSSEQKQVLWGPNGRSSQQVGAGLYGSESRMSGCKCRAPVMLQGQPSIASQAL